MNYNYQDGPIDLSTAPSSSNMNYYAQSGSNNYSSQFWTRKPQQNQYAPHSMGNSLNTSINNSGTANTSMTSGGYANDSEVDKLKLQMKVKESQIESLEGEIQRLNESLSRGSNAANSRIPTQVPQSINEMFVSMSSKYEKASKELEDTKQRLESLITAISLNPSNNITNNGRYDELEISHKILIKLQNLKKENEELMRQLSFGKVKQMELEMNLLKRENDELKRENEQLKKTRN
jgi:hypothetical protein